MTDALTSARRAERLREEKERREEIIKLGYQLTNLRAQKEEIDLLLTEKENRLTELLRKH